MSVVYGVKSSALALSEAVYEYSGAVERVFVVGRESLALLLIPLWLGVFGGEIR